ncbi:hypothetical protein A1F94_000259 [Pyrenophora tritici-repentis]|nr:hypothetical protein A1F94_000259 [Pyrenophora tritici-repentis]
MIRTGSPNPYDSVHDWMPSIRGATIHRVNMVDAATDRELLDYANTHGAKKW